MSLNIVQITKLLAQHKNDLQDHFQLYKRIASEHIFTSFTQAIENFEFAINKDLSKINPDYVSNGLPDETLFANIIDESVTSMISEIMHDIARSGDNISYYAYLLSTIYAKTSSDSYDNYKPFNEMVKQLIYLCYIDSAEEPIPGALSNEYYSLMYQIYCNFTYKNDYVRSLIKFYKNKIDLYKDYNNRKEYAWIYNK